MSAHTERKQKVVTDAREIWQDNEQLCEKWLTTVFEDPEYTMLKSDYSLDLPDKKSRGCPERYLQCERDGDYSTSLDAEGKLIRTVHVSDAVLLLRKGGLTSVLLDANWKNENGEIEERRNKMPGGKVNDSDRKVATSIAGLEAHQIAVLRECFEELPWPVFGVLGGQWYHYQKTEDKHSMPPLNPSKQSFPPLYVVFQLDESSICLDDPSPESQQRFTGITRRTRYWFTKATLVDSASIIPLQSRVLSSTGDKKDVFRWMPITTNSIHMLSEKSICPQQFLQSELSFGASRSLTPSPPLHPYALLESMTNPNSSDGKQLRKFIVECVNFVAEETGTEAVDIVRDITKSTAFESKDLEKLEIELKSYTSLVKWSEHRYKLKIKKKGSDRTESSYELHNRHIQLLIHRLGNFLAKHFKGERDSKTSLEYSYRLRKRIPQALILDQLSALYSYESQSDNRKEYSNRHVNESELSQRLFKDWFGEKPDSKPLPEPDDILKIFDEYNTEGMANGLQSKLQLHKLHYSNMIHYPCKSCDVKAGIPCPSSKRKNIGDSPTGDGNKRFKRTIELKEAVETFYESRTKLQSLKVDFSPTKDLHLYKAPFSCKERNLQVSKRDILVGTLVPKVRKEGKKTPHQFFGVQCPAPFTVQSNMFGSVSRTVHRMVWQKVDRYSMKIHDGAVPIEERLLWEFITPQKSITTVPVDREEPNEKYDQLDILSFKPDPTSGTRFKHVDAEQVNEKGQMRPNSILSPADNRMWTWKHSGPRSYLEHGALIGEGKLPIISPDSSLREAIEIATSNGIGVAIGIDAWFLDEDIVADSKTKSVPSSRCLEDERWHIEERLFDASERGIGARTFCGFMARLHKEKRLNIASKKVLQERRVYGILLLEDMLHV
ncbi:hypothetical protein N9M86_00340 [Euryarchaeota archaeon]|nr:hypothetical protein [Euryarchaeota archaeon]MDA8689522.1 hypothetical protein [Euryarchaeota archaeon]MDA9156098.1 hypothetical protein [Candidatus Poseidoniaceae archaeon]